MKSSLFFLSFIFCLGELMAHDALTYFTYIKKEESGWTLSMQFETSGLLKAAAVDLKKDYSSPSSKIAIEQKIKTYLLHCIHIKIDKNQIAQLSDFKIGMNAHTTEVNFQLTIPKAATYWDIQISALSENPRFNHFLKISEQETTKIHPLNKKDMNIQLIHLANGSFKKISSP